MVLEIKWHTVIRNINDSKWNVRNGRSWLTIIRYYNIGVFIKTKVDSIEIGVLNVVLSIKIEIYWRKERICNR